MAENFIKSAFFRLNFEKKIKKTGAVQKEMSSPNYFKFTRELKSAKI